jgi:hypothetical protein
MKLQELKNVIVRDHTGKPLRGLAREIALRAKADRIAGPEPKIKDERIGNAKIVKEDALDTKSAEDLWSENADSAAEYRTAAQYLVRPIKGSNPPSFEAFEVTGNQRKPFGKYNAKELDGVLSPIRAGQTPDAEGFTVYVDAESVEAFQYDGDPIKVVLGDEGGQRLSKGDYVIRTNDGNDFKYSIDKASSFEATLKKV